MTRYNDLPGVAGQGCHQPDPLRRLAMQTFRLSWAIFFGCFASLSCAKGAALTGDEEGVGGDDGAESGGNAGSTATAGGSGQSGEIGGNSQQGLGGTQGLLGGSTGSGGTGSSAGGAPSVDACASEASTEQATTTFTPGTGGNQSKVIVNAVAGQSLPLDQISVNYCFLTLGKIAVTVNPAGVKVYGGVQNLTESPYYISLQDMAATASDSADGTQHCIIFDLSGKVSAAMASANPPLTVAPPLTGDAANPPFIEIGWTLDGTVLGSAGMIDPSKPVQIMVYSAGTLVSCSSSTG